MVVVVSVTCESKVKSDAVGKSGQALQRCLPLVSISVLQAVISKTNLRIATCRMPLWGRK